jgi:hypothetical protein
MDSSCKTEINQTKTRERDAGLLGAVGESIVCGEREMRGGGDVGEAVAVDKGREAEGLKFSNGR